MMRGAAFSAANGDCDRALFLYTQVLTETEVDLQPMATGISPCFDVLTANPSAYPEVAAAFGVIGGLDP